MLDSSALVDYLIGRASPQHAASIKRTDIALNIPALCDVEVLSGLRGVVRRRSVARAAAGEALQAYRDLPLIRHEHDRLLSRAFGLETFSAYDAVYVALAEALGARLLTTDARLARAVASARGLSVALG